MSLVRYEVSDRVAIITDRQSAGQRAQPRCAEGISEAVARADADAAADADRAHRRWHDVHCRRRHQHLQDASERARNHSSARRRFTSD